MRDVVKNYTLLEKISDPKDLRALPQAKLPEVAAEMRQAICDQVSKTGGHLAPNLGVVELTLALHYVFDFGRDRLLFDVGHQCYPHKLLTGRFRSLPTLRKTGGIAGFPEPRESSYDLFSVGHAGTGISTAILESAESRRKSTWIGKSRTRSNCTSRGSTRILLPPTSISKRVV